MTPWPPTNCQTSTQLVHSFMNGEKFSIPFPTSDYIKYRGISSQRSSFFCPLEYFILCPWNTAKLCSCRILNVCAVKVNNANYTLGKTPLSVLCIQIWVSVLTTDTQTVNWDNSVCFYGLPMSENIVDVWQALRFASSLLCKKQAH